MITLYQLLNRLSHIRRGGLLWNVGILLALIFSLKLTSIPATARELAMDDFSAIDHYVEEEMDAARLPGLALGIVKGDQIVHLKGFGRADETGRPVTPQTPFVIGSTTKSFTALAIMQLVEAGKVELDAPVQHYLPWFRVADPQASVQITIRHLLNQTSGLPSIVGTKDIFREDRRTAALEEAVRALQNVALDRPVGESFEYCNMNYSILGLVIESVSGQAYEQYISDHIFKPLEMNNSYADYGEAQQNGLAQGYLYWWEMPRPRDLIYNREGLPSGALVSTADDMSHYLIAHINGGVYGNVTVLSADGVSTTHSPAVPASAMGNSSSYGMGWFVGEMDGVPAVWDPGSVMNFRSDLIMAPENKWGIVVLINAWDYTGSPGGAIASGVFSLLAGHEPAPSSRSQIPIAQFALLGILILQGAGIVRSVNLFKRWRLHPESMPGGKAGLALHVGLPLILNLVWAAVCLKVLPSVAGVPLFDLRVIDIGQVGLLSGFLAVGWGIIRTVFAYRELKKV